MLTNATVIDVAVRSDGVLADAVPRRLEVADAARAGRRRMPARCTAAPMLITRSCAVASVGRAPVATSAAARRRRARSSSSAAGHTMASPVPMQAPAITSLAQCAPR